jgi:hypothetical protein
VAGSGGTGVASSISGAQRFYAAGGGAGGGFPIGSTKPGLGIAGVSGNGVDDDLPSFSGTANTGGGGGGNGQGGIFASANGGSGIVIIRYPSYLNAAASTTGGPEMYIAGAWRVYKFVASGTITF